MHKKKTPNVLTVEGTEWSFVPNEITVVKGEEVTIIFKNVGRIAHNFGIGEFGLITHTILPFRKYGKTDRITFTPTKTGTFPFWCSVPGHRDAGMEGKLIIRD